MKYYNSENYKRYKADLKKAQPEGLFWDEYSEEQLIIKFTPLAEKIARKFSFKDSASGIMNLQDAMSFATIGLISAVRKINWETILDSDNTERTLKAFLAKRIRGSIRRSIDRNRSAMRIPEHKLNALRDGFEDSPDKQAMYYNASFTSIDESNGDDVFMQIEDTSEDPLKIESLHRKLLKIMTKHLDSKEFHIIRYSFGLGVDKKPAKEIAEKLGIQGSSSYVRVSQLKKQAIEKLRKVMNYSDLAEYL